MSSRKRKKRFKNTNKKIRQKIKEPDLTISRPESNADMGFLQWGGWISTGMLLSVILDNYILALLPMFPQFWESLSKLKIVWEWLSILEKQLKKGRTKKNQ